MVNSLIDAHLADVDPSLEEVFIQAHRSLYNFRGHSKFSTWLHRVAVNVCYSQLRRVSVDLSAGEAVSPPYAVGISERQIDARRQVYEMYQLIDAMPAKNRVVFVLREFQGLTLAEIAETLDIPLHTAASRLRRGRASLMHAFAENVIQNKGEEK